MNNKDKRILIDPNEMLGICLKKAFRLDDYIRIIRYVDNNEFDNPSFRKLFNSYFKVSQQNNKWYNRYYELMSEQRKKNRNIGEIIEELHKISNRIDVSFASKLIAIIDRDNPIWDKYVLRNLGLDKDWKAYKNKPYEERKNKAVKIYSQIKDYYTDFLNTDEGNAVINQFKNALSEYKNKISDVKIIDFILWSKR